jgi:hypothetical protein
MGVYPIRTDCVTIFLNVVAKGGTMRWNRHITPDLCLATSWLHDLIYVNQLGAKGYTLRNRSFSGGFHEHVFTTQKPIKVFHRVRWFSRNL